MVNNLAKVAIGVTGVASVGATAVYLSASKTEEKKILPLIRKLQKRFQHD